MRGSIRKRGKSWQGRVDVGADPKTGKRKIRYITRSTKRKVEEAIAETLNQVQHGAYVERSPLTFAEWLNHWYKVAIHQKTRYRTYTTYRAVIDNHLIPNLGMIPLQQLESTHLEDYYASSSLSQATLQQHHAIIYAALNSAQKKRKVTRNEAALVEGKPRAKRNSDDLRDDCWEAHEAKAFLEAARAEGPQQAAFYSLALECGLRKGELGGLKWRDVDLKGNRISIVRQLIKPGPAPTFGPPKNGTSRTIGISPELVELLQAHKSRQAELKLRNRSTYRDHGLVFSKEWKDISRGRAKIGDPLQLNNIGEREFAKLINSAGVHRIRFHGLRHTAATLALAEGVDPKVVQERLGHKTAEITMNTYAHALPSKQEEAAKRMGSILYG